MPSRTDGEFSRFLATCGLAAAGSSETMAELAKRYGVRRWFDFSDVVQLPAASLFPEQTEPFFFLVDRTCLLPPSGFECDFDHHRNGLRTHECALRRLTALFGTPEDGVAVNTLSATWKFERMSISIRTFLREKTTGRSDLYVRHPGLWDLCRISIDRDWVRPFTEADACLLNSLGFQDILPVSRSVWPAKRSLSTWERGLFRLAGNGPDTPPFLWKQSGAIGWRAGPLVAVFERSLGPSLLLERAQPARSAGYSRLVLRLHNPFSLEHEPADTVVLTGDKTNTLDRVAPDVSAFWECPIRSEEFADD
jgi:hypothetical protein